MNTLRIGLAGAGVIGETHALMLHEIARAFPGWLELVAVADPDSALCEQAQRNFGFRETYADGATLLERADIDTLFVCTPTHAHAELVEAAAARRLHLFCEKPLAMSYAEGCRMVEAVEGAGCRAQIGLVLRYSAVYTLLRQQLQDPAVGRTLAVVFRDDQCFPIRGLHASPWRADRSRTAGGTLIEHGVHDLDLLTWFFGPVESLQAWQRNLAGHPGVEDYVAIELTFAGGVQAQLVNVWHDMLQRPSNRRLEVFCERAFLASDHDMLGSLRRQLGDEAEGEWSGDEVLQRFRALHGAEQHPLRDWFGVSYLVQDLAFVEALRAGRDPEPGLRVGLEAQRLAEAAYVSAREGCSVRLADFAGDATAVVDSRSGT